MARVSMISRNASLSWEPVLPDPVGLEDWKGRGITPIPYDAANGHSALLDTLERWAALSAINGKRDCVDAEVKRIVRTNRSAATDADRDIFDHLIRRSDSNERVRLSALASRCRRQISVGLTLSPQLQQRTIGSAADEAALGESK